MGKISYALKKIAEEREQKKEVQQTQIIEEVKNKEKEEENIAADRTTSQKDISFLKKFKERLRSLNPDLFYIAKATDSSGIDPRIVTYFDYFSPISEQYRTLRTNIRSYLFKENKSTKLSTTKSFTAPKIFTISSALPGEGKTITCVNLATSLAEELESRVLLVDCDLRNGTLHKFLNIEPIPGIADVLTYNLDYSATLQPTQLKNLFVIPRGKLPPNPSEVLSSKKMGQIIEKLKAEQFTHIIIDTPPLIPFTDAGLLSAQTNGAILVVQAHRTQARVLKRAKELLDQSYSRLLGFILTQSDYNIKDSYYSYYYHRNYSKNKAVAVGVI